MSELATTQEPRAHGARARAPRRAPRVLTAAAALGALLVLAPLAFTLWRASAMGIDEAAELLFRPLVGELLLNTLWITLGATLASALIGTAAAWFIERTHLPGRRLWAMLAAAPLAMPAFVSSYAWVSISLDLQDFAGALLVITSAYFPLVYLPVAAALRGMDPALEETARSLGCGRWAVFLRVVLPQLRPALLGGMLLVALGVLSEFGAFQMLRYRTFTTEIYAEYRTSFDNGGASLVACVLLVLCLVLLALEFRLRGAARYERVDRGARRAALCHELGRWRWPVTGGFAALAIVTLGVPLGMIGFWLTQEGAAAVTPAEVSPRLLFDATVSSVGFGLLAAIVTVALAFPLALLLVRYPGRLATAMERSVFLAQGVPGLVIALALVSLAVRALQPLYQGVTLLIVAYAILFLPLALVSVRAALMQAQPRLEDTARSLGLDAVHTFVRVMLPLAGPGFGAAAAMVFISVVTELNATLLLAPLDTHTLATQVWSDTSTLAFRRRRTLCGIAHLDFFLRLGRAVRPARPVSAARHALIEAAASRPHLMNELRVQGLCKAFGHHPVLHGVDLTVARGMLFALLGPSGSGKTTFLRLLCGFGRADAGTIEIDGRQVDGPGAFVPSEQRRIGYVPQEGALFPHLSVAENIVFGLPRGQRRAQYRVAELLELVGLPQDYAGRAPQQLSGGQQQRVALARALAPSPGLILLDEPFSSLDAALRVETRRAVARALADTGTTAVLVTHDQSEALSMGQRVAVLAHGKLVQSGPAQEIYRQPATRELAEFIGDAVMLPGIAHEGFATCALGRLGLSAPCRDGAVEVMIRPEQIRLVASGASAEGVAARVIDIVFNGRDAHVTLGLEQAEECTVVACVPGYGSPQIGDPVILRVEGCVIAYPSP